MNSAAAAIAAAVLPLDGGRIAAAVLPLDGGRIAAAVLPLDGGRRSTVARRRCCGPAAELLVELVAGVGLRGCGARVNSAASAIAAAVPPLGVGVGAAVLPLALAIAIAGRTSSGE